MGAAARGDKRRHGRSASQGPQRPVSDKSNRKLLARQAKPSGPTHHQLTLAGYEALDGLLGRPDLKKTSVWLDERTVVKVTRRFKVDRRARSETVVMTLGRPNYAERALLKRNGGCIPLGVLFYPWLEKH